MSTSNFHRWTVFTLGALVAITLSATPRADADPKFFPGKSKFKTKDDLKFGDLLLKDTKLKNFKDVKLKPGKGEDFVKKYKADFKGLKKFKGVDPLPFRLKGPIKKSFTPTKEKGKWETEMISMDLTGSFPKDPKLKVKLKKSQGPPSLGRAILAGDSKDPVLVDSFFDIFFELSLDGGTPTPMEGGPARYTLARVPEPASMGLLAAGLLGLTAYGRQRTKRRAS